MKQKMLVLDIDGTLTNRDKEITPRTLARIRESQEMGHIVVIASGRPTPGMMKVAGTLELKQRGGYLLSYNGARIEEMRTGEVVRHLQLPREYLPELYAFAGENDMGLLTYEPSGIVNARRRDEYIALESRVNSIPIHDVDNFVEYVDFPITKCLLTATVDRAPELERALAEQFAGRISVYRAEPFYIEAMPLGVDKARALQCLIDHLGMDVSDVIACGDGFNDVSLIRWAGLGVAMSNAQDAVKAEADYITLSNDEDGVAHVIEKFILGIGE